MRALSILTPTWNRSDYLRRVHAALDAQTCHDFEWIVADDGSTDNTRTVVRELASNSKFPILYLSAECHVGKVRMDNEAIRSARTDLLLWCDSDDMLLDGAVESLLSAWHGIPGNLRDEFVGVTALAKTSAGILESPFPGATSPRDVSWNDLASNHGVTGDMAYMVRTEVMRANLFPEVDLVVPESAVWNVVGHAKSRFIPEVVLVKEYGAANAISFTGKMNYNRGRAYAAAIMQRELGSGLFQGLRRIFNFQRYCIHGELSWRFARRLWGGNSSSITFWGLAPLATLIAYIDAAQGKVVQSHREFVAHLHCAIAGTWLPDEGSK